ncbi:MAG: hypothetical protein GC161_13810 [Planctomycetaceae bacterium]|nr:hypothetical protein [Planctomycetaceae bacterium]
MSLEIRCLDADSAQEFAAGLSALERDVWYPLGADRFRIDHGRRYTAFFERLGEVHVHLALEAETVVGVLVAVLRRSPFDGRDLWYLADLKSRGEGASVTASLWGAFRDRAGAGRGFAVSMDPASGTNRLVHMAVRRLRPRPAALARLQFHFLDAEGAERAVRELEPLLGAVSFVDLSGAKDLRLESTGRPWPLLHAQFGPWAQGDRPLLGARRGFAHAFCAVEGSQLAAQLHSIAPVAARATLLAHGLGLEEVGAPLTGDI